MATPYKIESGHDGHDFVMVGGVPAGVITRARHGRVVTCTIEGQRTGGANGECRQGEHPTWVAKHARRNGLVGARRARGRGQLAGWLDDDDPEANAAEAAYYKSLSPVKRAAIDAGAAANKANDRARKLDSAAAYTVAAEAYEVAAAATRAADNEALAATYSKLASYARDAVERKKPKVDPPVKWTGPWPKGTLVKRIPWRGTKFPLQQRGKILNYIDWRDNDGAPLPSARVRFDGFDGDTIVLALQDIAPLDAKLPKYTKPTRAKTVVRAKRR